jgi:hypothetical protein
VVIPTAVYREFVQGWGTGSLPVWVSVKTLGEGDMEEFGDFSIGEGESQAIVLAKGYGWLLGIDDERARNVAKKNGVKVVGSLGILKIAYEKCFLESKRELQIILEDLSKDVYLEDWLIAWVLEAEKE